MQQYNLCPPYQHKETAADRDAFTSKKKGAGTYTRSEIVESWKRCEDKKIDPAAIKLPNIEKQDTERAKKHVTGYTMHLRVSFSVYYHEMQQMLSASGVCLCYVANNFDIYGRYGNQELKNELKSKNIALGCNMSESIVGTNSVALAAITQKDAWVTGAEHYMQAMQDYASFAFPVQSGHDKNFYIMLIVRRRDISPITASLFNLIKSTECIVSAGKANTDIIVKNKLLEYNMTSNETVLITVSHCGIIMDINNIFEELFKKSFDSIINRPLVDILPELEFTLGCFKKGKSLSMQEVSFASLPRNESKFFIDATPLKEYGQWLGMVITMTKEKKITKIINKIANFNAHFTFDDLLGVSEKFRNVKKMAKLVANNPSNVLILGESGTGKELFAHAIHNASDRHSKAFITVNCAAIPRELIGSELFGYTPGAFTGANKEGAQGKFELSGGGTLFLDEIAEMPMDMQTVLLRVLEDKTVTRLGGKQPINVDVRLITATNQNLQQLVKEGKFRLDLYYRLNVIRLDLVPLRERPEDIPILVNHYIKTFSQSFGKNITNIEKEAMNILQSYDWPGNVRELRNTIERGINLAAENTFTASDLPTEILVKPGRRFAVNGLEKKKTVITQLNNNYDLYKKELAAQLMEKYRGNKSKVASELGIARTTLYRLLKN